MKCLESCGYNVPSFIDSASVEMKRVTPSPEWRYTFWSAEFIAEKGLDGRGAAQANADLADYELPQDIAALPDGAAMECGNTSPYRGFTDASGAEAAIPLRDGHWWAIDRLESDPRYKEAIYDWRKPTSAPRGPRPNPSR
jgi:hypothetical protein